jgi:hypothetical protein
MGCPAIGVELRDHFPMEGLINSSFVIPAKAGIK